MQNKLVKTAFFFSTLTPILLVIIKFTVWLSTGSIAILSSLVDSTLDIIMSFCNSLVAKYSVKPKDKDHQFGHTAIEDLGAMFQVVIMAGSGIFVIYDSFENYFNNIRPSIDKISIFVMLISLIFTIILCTFLKYVIKKTNSLLLKTEILHYTSDILMNGGIILSLILIKYLNWYMVDYIIGIGIGIYIIISSYDILKMAFNNLMCKSLPKSVEKKITSIIKENASIKSYKNLKTRQMGSKSFIQVIILLDGNLSLNEVHNIMDGIEYEIKEQIVNADIIIHSEPHK